MCFIGGTTCSRVPNHHVERDKRERSRSQTLVDSPATCGRMNTAQQKGHLSSAQIDEICNQRKWILCEATKVGGRFLCINSQSKHGFRKT